MEFITYLTFVGTALMLVFMPGPDSIYVLTKSLSAGARTGILLSWGLATGAISHTFLVMVGVAAFLQSSPMAMKGVSLFGAAYILTLSYRAFRSSGFELNENGESHGLSGFPLFRSGFLMNASNPKVLLFFLALLPQFVRNNAPLPPAFQIGLMGMTFALLTGIIFSGYAVCASKARTFLLQKKSFPLIMARVEGTLLLLIALALLFLE